MKFKQFFQRRSSSTSALPKSSPKKSEKDNDGFLQLSFMKKEKKQSPVQNNERMEGLLECKSERGQEVHDDVQCENCGNDAHGSEAILQLETSEELPNGPIVQAIKSEIVTITLDESNNESEALNESHTGSSSVHMQSVQDHELDLMKDETERFKAMYEEMCTNFKDISIQLENLKQEFDGKKKEWEKSQVDFMLCIRSAERFAHEAEARAKTVEAENIRLKEELSKIRDLSNPLQSLETNYPDGKPRRWVGAVDLEQSEKAPNGGTTIVIPPPQSHSKDCEDSSKPKTIPEPKQTYQHNGTNSRTGKLENLRKTAGGSLRNALLRWCREQTKGYENIEINNFSTSWQDGKAFAALLHSLQPTAFDYGGLLTSSPLAKYEVAINSAKQLGVKVELDIVDVLSTEDPPWEKILQFVTEVYCAVTP